MKLYWQHLYRINNMYDVSGEHLVLIYEMNMLCLVIITL